MSDASTTGPATGPAAARRAPGWLIRYGNGLFRARDAVFPLGLLLLLVLTRPFIDDRPDAPLRWLDAVGVLIAVAGQTLRVAVVGYRYIVRGGRKRQVYADGLVTTGFFALSRNPLYVGNLLILAGVFVLWNSPVLYLAGVPFFLLGYRAIVAAEEDYLGRQYGASFDDYCRAVPRWWPALGRLRDATTGMAFNWPRVIIKEYGSAAYWVGGVIVILALKARRYAHVQGRPEDLRPYAGALAVVAVLWATARILKKSRRLHE